MERKSKIAGRLVLAVVTIAMVTGIVFGLLWVNERMDVRYQAVGMVSDATGQPLQGVEAVLLLAPPASAGIGMNAVFRKNRPPQEGVGEFKGAVGPTIGLSDHKGLFVVRATGRIGLSRTVRFGLDSDRPVFEVAWLLLRKKGYASLTRTVSILGWRTAPKGWGKHANRLPVIVMEKE